MLDKFFVDAVDKTDIKELIKRRRLQMLVHSCLYYELNEIILSDDTWQQWADELQRLQEQNPDCLEIGCWDYEFRDWTGATGAHLPHRHPWVYNKAKQVYEVATGVKL